MATDLKTIYDHPAQVLAAHYNYRRTKLEITNAAYSAVDNSTVQDVINVLGAYEIEHNVTFAALDNDTLVTVREAYRGATEGESTSDRHGSKDDLVRAVCDLLGLDD